MRKKKDGEMKVSNVKISKNGIISFSISKGNKKGHVTYAISHEYSGIVDCSYIESKNEDIYLDIHDWISKNISFEKTITIKYKNKKVIFK